MAELTMLADRYRTA